MQISIVNLKQKARKTVYYTKEKEIAHRQLPNSHRARFISLPPFYCMLPRILNRNVWTLLPYGGTADLTTIFAPPSYSRSILPHVWSSIKLNKENIYSQTICHIVWLQISGRVCAACWVFTFLANPAVAIFRINIFCRGFNSSYIVLTLVSVWGVKLWLGELRGGC